MNSLTSFVLVILRKELIDGLRDRRSVFSTLMFPLMIPALIIFMFDMMADKRREPGRVEVPVVGAEYAPALMDWLQQRGIHAVDGPADPYLAVREREVDYALVIPEDYAEKFASGRTVELELFVDSSHDEGDPEKRKIHEAVEGYEKTIASLRLIARGVSPQIVRPIKLNKVEIASAQKLSARILLFIPMYVLMAAFMAGMNVAIDTTAGERERESLECLLVNPVPRLAIVLGKWLAAVAFSVSGIALTLGGMVVALRFVPLPELGLRFNLGPFEVVGVLAATLPMAFLATGLQVLIASFARSFKEAQTYMSLLMLIPMIPVIAFMVKAASVESWMYPIPVLGQQALMTKVLQGETASFGFFLLAGISSLIIGFACVAVTARLFRRENIIYGR
jgi:sodium transport system permease protein